MKEWTEFKDTATFRKMTVQNLDQDIQPQDLLERWLKFTFEEGIRRIGGDHKPIVYQINDVTPEAVIALYNKVFNRNVEMLDHRISAVRGRIAQARKAKIDLHLRHFQTVFENKRNQWQTDPEKRQWLTVETLCSKKFFKYLDEVKDLATGSSSKLKGKMFSE